MNCPVIVSRLILPAIVLMGSLVAPGANGQELNFSDISVTLQLPHPKGNTGATVPAEIRFQGAAEVSAFQMALLYDEKLLEVVKVEKGELLGENAIFEFDNDVKGRLGLGFLSGPDATGKQLAKINGSGVIAVVHFKVLGKGPRRTPLSPDRVRAWGVHDAELTVRSDPGEFTILGNLPWLWIVLAILAVIAIGLLIRWMRKPPK